MKMSKRHMKTPLETQHRDRDGVLLQGQELQRLCQFMRQHPLKAERVKTSCRVRATLKRHMICVPRHARPAHARDVLFAHYLCHAIITVMGTRMCHAIPGVAAVLMELQFLRWPGLAPEQQRPDSQGPRFLGCIAVLGDRETAKSMMSRHRHQWQHK
mmetsp:Transcript_92748/g.170385  ORF Transcript_92748/g.170385 Transcript_92748/m.170385 type:complete len:157 (+) Transcript_92748:541-1011(+)